MASNVSTVYINVIDDVINKVRDDFVASGAGEAVLNELQAVIISRFHLFVLCCVSRVLIDLLKFILFGQIWETKMMRWGAISGNIERPPPIPRHLGPITPVHDLNVPYEGPVEEYETPTAEMLFPPVSALLCSNFLGKKKTFFLIDILIERLPHLFLVGLDSDADSVATDADGGL